MSFASAAHRAAAHPPGQPASASAKHPYRTTSWIASIGKKHKQACTHRVAAHHDGHRQQDAGDELDHVLALLQGGQAAEREGRHSVGREVSGRLIGTEVSGELDRALVLLHEGHMPARERPTVLRGSAARRAAPKAASAMPQCARTVHGPANATASSGGGWQARGTRSQAALTPGSLSLPLKPSRAVEIEPMVTAMCSLRAKEVGARSRAASHPAFPLGTSLLVVVVHCLACDPREQTLRSEGTSRGSGKYLVHNLTRPGRCARWRRRSAAQRAQDHSRERETNNERGCGPARQVTGGD